MNTFSTCVDCHGLLQVTEHAQNTHPGCTAHPDRMDGLIADWLDAINVEDTETEDRLIDEIDTIATAPPRLGAAAMIYASWGWPVFPLIPLGDAVRIATRTGTPVTKVAKRPATRHGFKDATTDPGRIAAWWDRHPDSNIGLATGHHFDVIDVDTHKGGMTSYRYMTQHRDLIDDVHGRALTASGGLHLYIKPLGGGNAADGGRSLLPGIDFRGLGGYVVGPPSWLGQHVHRWSWAIKPSPEIRL